MESAAVAESSRRLTMMKSSLTLDVGTRTESAALADVVLSSPDVRLLQLASPELERLVLQQSGSYQEQQQYPYHQHHYHHDQQQGWSESDHPPMELTGHQQTEYTRGFVDALRQLQSRCDPPQPSSFRAPAPAAGQTAAGFDAPPLRRAPANTSGHVVFSETPPLSPIDPAEQERARLERKRERNRQAATRCRNRKLERIDQLQTQADRLRADNSRLSDDVQRLREVVNRLRRDVVLHSACQPPAAMPLDFDGSTATSEKAHDR